MLSAEGSGKATQGAGLACVEGEGACCTEAGGSLPCSCHFLGMVCVCTAWSVRSDQCPQRCLMKKGNQCIFIVEID